MTRVTITLCSIALSCGSSVLADSEFESAEDAIVGKFSNSDEGRSAAIIYTVLDPTYLTLDPCELYSIVLPSVEDRECSLEKEFLIDGISAEGQDILMTAAQEFEAHRLTAINEEERKFVTLCATGISEPVALANGIIDVRKHSYGRDLQFYESAISRLSESDLALLENHNLEEFGIKRPTDGGYRRELEIDLAKTYTEEYQERFFSKCIAATSRKALPIKR